MVHNARLDPPFVLDINCGRLFLVYWPKFEAQIANYVGAWHIVACQSKSIVIENYRVINKFYSFQVIEKPRINLERLWNTQ